jgi:hypothetical protein
MKSVALVIILVVVVLLIILMYTWARFRERIYIHTSSNQTLINKYPIKHQEVTLTTSDGIKVNSWYIPVKDAKAVVILIHGFTDKNGGKALMLAHADYLVKNGYSVFLPDLRVAGDSSGDKTYLGSREWKEVEASYDYLKSLKENQNKKVGLFGISMGAVTTIITSGHTGKGDFIIASVPFSSFDEQFKFELTKTGLWEPLFFPFLKIVAMIEFGNYAQYDPAKMIINIHKPILIIAGKNDQDIDYHQGEYLYSVANKPKYYWLAPTEHDVHLELPQQFQDKILEFLKKATP